jgi:hypothetical protein
VGRFKIFDHGMWCGKSRANRKPISYASDRGCLAAMAVRKIEIGPKFTWDGMVGTRIIPTPFMVWTWPLNSKLLGEKTFFGLSAFKKPLKKNFRAKIYVEI